MKKHFSFLGLAALLTAAALTSCQKEEWEMDSPSESESDLELADDGTRATVKGSYEPERDKLIINPEKGYYLHQDIFFSLAAARNSDTNWAVEEINGYGFPKPECFKFKTFNTEQKEKYFDKDGYELGRLVLLQFYLTDYRTCWISSEALRRISAILDNVRKANKKAIVRFSYVNEKYVGDKNISTSVFRREPANDMILKHIDQLKDVLKSHNDIIYVFQAGFIGTWGEWYYTSHWDLASDNKDFTARREIINAMLDAVPNRAVALRTPRFKQMYFNQDGSYTKLYSPEIAGTNHSNANGRLGLYNDVFMVDGREEQGTFRSGTKDKEMWEKQSAFVPAGGEPANDDATKKSILNSIADGKKGVLARIGKDHMSYLHYRPGTSNYKKTWNNTFFKALKDNGLLNKVGNALGYHLWLNNFTMSGNFSLGKGSTQDATIVFSLCNEGSAPVMYKRPMKLVLMRKNTVIQELASTTGSCMIGSNYNYIWFTTNNANTTQHGTNIDNDLADLRKIPSATTKFMTCKVRFPKNLQSGDCIALWMPDQNSDLRSVSDYSIRLCNKETKGFTWNNGYNIIYTLK